MLQIKLLFYTPGPCLVASKGQVHSDVTLGLFRPSQLLGLPRALCSGDWDGSEVRVTLLSAQQSSMAPTAFNMRSNGSLPLVRPSALWESQGQNRGLVFDPSGQCPHWEDDG